MTTSKNLSIGVNMKWVVAVGALIIASAVTFTPVSAKSNIPANSGSLGKVTYDTTLNAGINYGSGISDGEWMVSEMQGIQLGLRATDRTDGLLDVTGAKGNRIGVYSASTGFDTGSSNRAEWNYEWSVDLTNAKGNASGKKLSDYNLYLEQNYTSQSLFGVLGNNPVQLPMSAPGICDYLTDYVCQQSFNPTFGNTDFDSLEEGTYDLRIVLSPKTFNGPTLAVAIRVEVSN